MTCEICGREQGTVFQLCGRGLSGSGSIDTELCYKLGYERQKRYATLWKDAARYYRSGWMTGGGAMGAF